MGKITGERGNYKATSDLLWKHGYTQGGFELKAISGHTFSPRILEKSQVLAMLASKVYYKPSDILRGAGGSSPCDFWHTTKVYLVIIWEHYKTVMVIDPQPEIFTRPFKYDELAKKDYVTILQ
jgi:hypothetical protein